MGWWGTFAVLSLAALLEVSGDACFRSGMFEASGVARAIWLMAGAVVLGSYGILVNLPGWDFGRLLGVYVALFFVMAQLVASVRFHQVPTVPIWVGGGLVVADGMVIMFWQG